MRNNEKRRYPWHIIEFVLFLAILQVAHGQNPHDVIMLLQLLLQAHH